MAGDGMDAALLCRACAAPHYGEKVEFQAVPALMEFYNWLSQSQEHYTDFLPKQICMQCYDRLDEFHRFQLMCTESNNLLMSRFSKCVISKGGESFVISFKEDTNTDQQNQLSCRFDQDLEKSENVSQLNKSNNPDDEGEAYTNSSEYDRELGGSYKYLENDSFQTCEIDIKPDIGTINYTAYLGYEADTNNDTINSINIPKEKSSTPKNYNEQFHDSKSFLYMCDRCPKKFNVKERYEGHLRWHEGLKPFACKLCSKKYSRLERLRNHTLSDHADNPRRFYCTVKGCNKKYKNRETWKKHINMHSKEPPSNEDASLTGVDFLSHHMFTNSSFATGIWNL